MSMRFPAIGGFTMPKKREITRDNAKKGREERLDLLNSWNKKDPTPKEAVDNIIAEGR